MQYILMIFSYSTTPFKLFTHTFMFSINKKNRMNEGRMKKTQITKMRIQTNKKDKSQNKTNETKIRHTH